jgi:hypothetical protein
VVSWFVVSVVSVGRNCAGRQGRYRLKYDITPGEMIPNHRYRGLRCPCFENKLKPTAIEVVELSADWRLHFGHDRNATRLSEINEKLAGTF